MANEVRIVYVLGRHAPAAGFDPSRMMSVY